MTLAPAVNPSIRGVKGKPGILGAICATPGCGQMAQQRHHIWPKSFLRGQPYEWVTVDGILLQNTCGLCMLHHNAVTIHDAKIVWNSALKVLEWWENEGGMVEDQWVCIGLLDGEGEDLVGPPQAEAVAARKAEGLCPTCGKPHERKKPAGPARKTKTWAVQVPVDEREHGAEVLDEHVDEFSVMMGFGDESKGVRRYHVLTNVFAWVTQMKHEFLRDWEEAKDE